MANPSSWLAWLLWFWDAVIVPLWYRMDATELEAGLWQGGVVDVLPPGVNAVLSLQQDHQDPLLGTGFQAQLWLPIADAPPFPGVPWLDQAVDFVQRCRSRGLVVLVHCMAGISRSSLVTVAVIMKAKGYSRDRAMEFVSQRRPVAHPNPAFWDGLAEYETYLKGRP